MALNADISALLSHQFFDRSQTNAVTFGVKFFKTVKNSRQIFGCNAATRINYLKGQSCLIGGVFIGVYVQFDAAQLREFARILQQIGQNTVQSRPIALHRCGHFPFDNEFRFDGSVLQRKAKCVEDGFDSIIHVEGLDAGRCWLRFGLRLFEYLGHHCGQLLG